MDVQVRNQKFIGVGNSIAITVDPNFLKASKKKIGDVVSVRYSTDGHFMTIIPHGEINEAGVAEEKVAVVSSKVPLKFRQWVEKSLTEDAKAMKKLANL